MKFPAKNFLRKPLESLTLLTSVILMVMTSKHSWLHPRMLALLIISLSSIPLIKNAQPNSVLPLQVLLLSELSITLLYHLLLPIVSPLPFPISSDSPVIIPFLLSLLSLRITLNPSSLRRMLLLCCSLTMKTNTTALYSLRLPRHTRERFFSLDPEPPRVFRPSLLSLLVLPKTCSQLLDLSSQLKRVSRSSDTTRNLVIYLLRILDNGLKNSDP